MDCLFCKFATGEIPVAKIAENDRAFAINDINPVAPTHILVIPKDHQENAVASSKSDPKVLASIFSLVDEIVIREGLDGYRTLFNTGASAGQSVFHTHLHLIAGRSLGWPPG
ncbi:MAG: HIT domain-containing protein [Actinomycetota bacterium]